MPAVETVTKEQSKVERFKALQQQMEVLRERCEAIHQMNQARTIKELRKLCPDLPNTGEAFHLAHNWLVCRKSDTPEGRKARYLINNHNALMAKTYKLKSEYWSRKYRNIFFVD